MLELYELRQFMEFAKTGTLLKTAANLHISQPALSRNMNKLEEDLGVSLFVRQKNKLELNENGKYVLGLAEHLLEEFDSLTVKAREFDRRRRSITLGVSAPAPIWILAPLIGSIFPHMALITETASHENLLQDLQGGVYQLIATHIKPQEKNFYFKECGKESLMFALPKNHKYADRKSLSFAEMDGESLLLMSDIGFWKFVHTEKMPHSRFLTQTDRLSFNELVESSSLPSFTTALAAKYLGSGNNRVHIPISDKDATVTYYLVCRAERKKDFCSLFRVC